MLHVPQSCGHACMTSVFIRHSGWLNSRRQDTWSAMSQRAALVSGATGKVVVLVAGEVNVVVVDGAVFGDTLAAAMLLFVASGQHTPHLTGQTINIGELISVQSAWGNLEQSGTSALPLQNGSVADVIVVVSFVVVIVCVVAVVAVVRVVAEMVVVVSNIVESVMSFCIVVVVGCVATAVTVVTVVAVAVAAVAVVVVSDVVDSVVEGVGDGRGTSQTIGTTCSSHELHRTGQVLRM